MKGQYVTGILVVALFAMMSGCTEKVWEANAETCKSDNLRQTVDEAVMWKHSSQCQQLNLNANS